MNPTHLLLVAAGGAAGSVLRHLVGVAALRLAGPGFPWSTLAVNVVGSFLMGLFVELAATRLGIGAGGRLLVATGFLGGFTTFSAFSLDAATLVERGAMAQAATYVTASVVLAIAALFAGLALARTLP